VAPVDGLYVLFIGGNDVRDARDAADAHASKEIIDDAVGGAKEALRALALAGASIAAVSAACGIGGGLFGVPLLHYGFRMPLTRSVGEAILDYLHEERPTSLRREIFLSSRPPHAPLRSKINGWLAERLKKAGIETTRGGAHILRHSLAVHMLRSGQTLKGIGDVLGHRSPETTFIYTKLHVDDLRTVALDTEVVS